MIDIRPAAADDLPRIEQIYDAIHTAEENGAASVGFGAYLGMIGGVLGVIGSVLRPKAQG